MKKKILLIEPQKIVANSIKKALTEYDVFHVTSAKDALVLANEQSFSAVITELSLAGHSGFEFLYEFRSYEDWNKTPIIVFTSVEVRKNVVDSRSWKALKINSYLYKPSESLASLKDSLEKAIVIATT